MASDARPFWSTPPDEMLRGLGSGAAGLSDAEARRRSATRTAGLTRGGGRGGRLLADAGLLLNQFRSPIVLILVFAAAISAVLRDAADSLIILAIVLVSAGLGFWRERGAAGAVAKLLALVRVNATVLRDGAYREVPVDEVVPGDVVRLSAGDSIPGDCLVLEAKDLTVDESALTGETFPAGKAPGVLDPETPPARRTNALFLGTHTVSGVATALVVATGAGTEFGKVSERLRLRPPETDFERGVRRMGYLLVEVTSILVLAIFAANVYFHRPVLDSLLFSLALAVGLTPQLLPAIITINLSHGARRMAASRVIVKRLASIENFGAMTVLCSDKTGTLTDGLVRLRSALDAEGRDSSRVLSCGFLNASLETGFRNPIHAAGSRPRRHPLPPRLHLLAADGAGKLPGADRDPPRVTAGRPGRAQADRRFPGGAGDRWLRPARDDPRRGWLRGRCLLAPLDADVRPGKDDRGSHGRLRPITILRKSPEGYSPQVAKKASTAQRRRGATTPPAPGNGSRP